MKKVACYYYRTESGRTPAREFVDSLDTSSQRKFLFVKELLEEFGRRLPMPHAKYLGNEIFELRFYGAEGGIRVLYFFWEGDKVIFTNGFLKKTQRTPGREMCLAVERRRFYTVR